MKNQLFQRWLFVGIMGASSAVYPDTAQDILAGEQIYTQCIGCHSPEYHRTGPKHCFLLGRQAGEDEGFEFTAVMKNSAIIWTKATLDEFLAAPLKMLPGTSMGFAGIDKPEQRLQLIAYLATLNKDSPLCQ